MLPFVAIGLSAASLVLDIVGLAIPYWSYHSEGGSKRYSGLWTYCAQPKGGDASCVSLKGLLLADEIKATRAMEILGMLVILAALVCALLKLLFMKDKALLPKIGAGCAIAADSMSGFRSFTRTVSNLLQSARMYRIHALCILMIIGTVIYATTDGIKASDLHAGFALCIIAGVIGIAAGVVMFLGSKGE